jgi:hypothetical protein
MRGHIDQLLEKLPHPAAERPPGSLAEGISEAASTSVLKKAGGHNMEHAVSPVTPINPPPAPKPVISGTVAKESAEQLSGKTVPREEPLKTGLEVSKQPRLEPLKQLSFQTLEAAESHLKQLGFAEVKLGNNLTLANDIASVAQDMAEQGVRFDNIKLFTKPLGSDAGYFNCLTKPPELCFNSLTPPGQKIIQHEFSHLAHFQQNEALFKELINVKGYAVEGSGYQATYLPFNIKGLEPLIAQDTGRYFESLIRETAPHAVKGDYHYGQQLKELVAEMMVGLRNGKEYSADAMAIYQAMLKESDLREVGREFMRQYFFKSSKWDPTVPLFREIVEKRLGKLQFLK